MSVLPNAPLVEVVFELRWSLGPSQDIAMPFVFQNDVGYPILKDLFIDKAKKLGFNISKNPNSNNNGFLVPHSVDARFFKGENQEFPLLQIGPGIFAANQAADYIWENFKKLVLDGLSAVLDSYPKLKSNPLIPSHIELRYIDVFDSKYTSGKTVMTEFLNSCTELKLSPSKYLNSKIFVQESNKVRINSSYPIKGWKNTNFTYDIASGFLLSDEEIIRLESKVITKGENLNLPKSNKAILMYVDAWLDKAQDIASTFFKDLIKDEFYKKFEA